MEAKLAELGRRFEDVTKRAEAGATAAEKLGAVSDELQVACFFALHVFL